MAVRRSLDGDVILSSPDRMPRSDGRSLSCSSRRHCCATTMGPGRVRACTESIVTAGVNRGLVVAGMARTSVAMIGS